MDYTKVMGVEDLAMKSFHGRGVRIAILDSGFQKKRTIGNIASFVDGFGHATEITSILMGGAGIIGICGLASPSYYAVLDENGHGSIKSVVKGIYQALEDDMDVINLSLGFARTDKCPKTLEKACRDAYDAGKTVVCAAGNDGGPVNWPAALETTISVGSADENGLKTSFSGVGEVDFVAPGINLSVIDKKGCPKTVSGTSFSAALVTGVVTLLIGSLSMGVKYRDGVEKIRELLKCRADDVGQKGWDDMTGYGVISGKKHDQTVGMEIGYSFFGKILYKIKSLIGINDKGAINGRV